MKEASPQRENTLWPFPDFVQDHSSPPDRMTTLSYVNILRVLAEAKVKPSLTSTL